MANVDEAMKELTKAIERWARFVIVPDDPKKADLVLVVMEWEDAHSWGKEIACRDQLFVFDGGQLPNEKSEPIWTGDPERWGKWGGCSGAGQPVKELRKEIEKAEKNRSIVVSRTFRDVDCGRSVRSGFRRERA